MIAKEKIARIPWREYLSEQIVKILGIGLVALLLIITMTISAELNLNDLFVKGLKDTNYILVIILSTIAYLLVLIGFTKTVLFDMANEFGLRNESGKIEYNLRFWLFTLLIVSFCTAIYILLGVQLKTTYLVILPVLLTRAGLALINLEIPQLMEITVDQYYYTVRNFYFDLFFVIILGFSIIVFLSILTTFARRRIARRFRKEEKEETEKQGIAAIYKIFLWLLIPPFILSLWIYLFNNPAADQVAIMLIIVISLLAFIWWAYQLVKVIFLTVWRGVKITAFVTLVNLLAIIPLVFVLWLLPVIVLSIIDVYTQFGPTFTLIDIISTFIGAFINWILNFPRLIEVDFIIITSLATIVVGFAEGFAIIAIVSALFRGVEVARTGKIIVRSPPKALVIFKYLVMFGVWLSVLWDSLVGILEMLYKYLAIDIRIPLDDLYTIVREIIIDPISAWLANFNPLLANIPFLLIPIMIIFSGAFKFLSVTLITPRVKERGDVFFLLISTSFVLITTNILGYIYTQGIDDAPLLSIEGITTLLSSAVGTFADAESITFWSGFIFGIGWVFWRIILKRKPSVTPTTSTTMQVLTDSKEEISVSRKVTVEDIPKTVEDEEIREKSADSNDKTEEEE